MWRVLFQRLWKILHGLATPQSAIEIGAKEFAEELLKRLRAHGGDV